MGWIGTLTFAMLAVIWRPLVTECLDTDFMRIVDGRGSVYHFLFLFLVVVNLIAGFEALGTLMAVGMMMLPAAIARLWARTLTGMVGIAIFGASLSGFVGLLVSFYARLASGPTIILTSSVLYGLSLLMAPSGALRRIHKRLTSRL